MKGAYYNNSNIIVYSMPKLDIKVETPDTDISKKIYPYTETQLKLDKKAPNYKFNEPDILKEIKEYIDSTYSQHYMLDGRQTLERSKAKGYALGSCITNCMKYTDRYELKGTISDWRKDLIKNIHYGILALHLHDEKYNKKEE